MKLLYFFDLQEGNFHNFYNFLKKIELKRGISVLKNFYHIDDEIEVRFYCLNKDLNYLKKNKYNSSINYVINEYLKIDREQFRKLIRDVWKRVNNFYEKLIKGDFSKLNDFWNITESYIKTDLTYLFEKIEFIKSIIKRENPDFIVLMQEHSYLYKILTFELEFVKDKFLFLNTKVNKIFRKSDLIIDLTFRFLFHLKYFFTQKNEFEKVLVKKYQNHLNYIGICCLKDSFWSTIQPIYQELINQKVNVKIFGRNIIKSYYSLNFKRFKFKLLTFIRVFLFWKEHKIRIKLIKNFKEPIKEFAFFYLNNFFFKYIIKVIYWQIRTENEIKVRNYKIILILNEYGPIGKIISIKCQKYQIPVYFTPYVGIPQFGSYVTPYFCDIINAEGLLNKKYLIARDVNPNKIIVRGAPKYEYAQNRKINKIKILTDFFSNEKIVLSNHTIKILITTNPITDESNKIILTKAINVLKKFENIQLIIKLHPRESGNILSKILRNLKSNAIVVKHVNIFEMLKTADILITQQSATILDSMVIGTPIICLDFINKRVGSSGKLAYNDEKFIEIAYNEKELYQKLSIFFNHPEKLSKYKQKIKENLCLFVYNKENYSSTKKIVSDLVSYL